MDIFNRFLSDDAVPEIATKINIFWGESIRGNQLGRESQLALGVFSRIKNTFISLLFS